MAVQYDVKGLVVVVVGGTSGLGLSTAVELVQQGAYVAVMGRNQMTLDSALVDLGENAIGMCGDASEPTSVGKLIDLAVARFGRLDAVYHVAGGSGQIGRAHV